MNLKLIPTPEFTKSVKKLAKKYRLIARDLTYLEQELTAGRFGIELGHHCYKIRIPNASIPTGKSGGFRVIYFYRCGNEKIYLLEIYAKTEIENIDDNRLIEILKNNDLS